MVELIDYKKEFSKRLRSLVDKSEVLQVKLCKDTNIKTNNLTHYLNGRIPRNPKDLESLARYFNKTIDWLLTGKEPSFDYINESRPVYETEVYTQEEKGVVEEFRAASNAGRETGRMVFRMNLKELKKTKQQKR